MILLHRISPRLSIVVMATACTFALSACSGSDETLNRDLAAPKRVDVLSPPVAPDPDQMHPALQIARSRGLKTNVYFNEELQQAVSRLQGMEETLGRLQSDLQGTAMAMQRVEMMRQEIESLNVRIQSIQERLLYAGPMLAPAPEAAPAAVEMTEATTQPTPLMGDMATPDTTGTVQVSKPVLDEKSTPVAAAPKAAAVPAGNGVVGVRAGAHADRVRLVLDVAGGQTQFSSNLDNAEKVLTVELPSTPWSAAKSEALKGNPLVASYSAQSADKGSVVAFTLKGSSKIIETKTLKGADGKPSRLIIDLAR